MKALASLFVAASLAGAVPAVAGARISFPAPLGASSHGVVAPVVSGHGGFGGGFHEHHSRGRFFGSSWVVPDFYAGGYSDIGPEPSYENVYHSHFVGASWIVPGVYAGAPRAPYYVPASHNSGASDPEPNTGPRILYLHGAPAKVGNEPMVVYGTSR